MKVLIVDDSVMIQERIGLLVKSCDVVTDTYQAYNLSEAKTLIEKIIIDVVVIDIRMPDGSGFELLEYVKNSHSNIMTIMITNYPFNQYKVKAKEMGVNYFLSKQNDFELIEPSLRQLKVARDILKLN